MGRYLITTADERSWKFDRPVLFLGEWCRLYDRKQAWEGLDAAVAEPFGLEPGQKRKDLAYLLDLTATLMRELSEALNEYHRTRHSLRYWNIVAGHWLRRYVEVLFNRYFTLERVLEKHKISGTTVFDFSSYSLSSKDSLSFIWACNDDAWNHVLYAKILNYFGIKTEIISLPFKGESGFVQKRNSGVQRENGLKHFILSTAKHALPKFKRNTDAFIINSYLPLIEEAKLELSLGQCPQLWESPELEYPSPVQENRKKLTLDEKNHKGFEWFVRSQLKEVIPVCYMEGFDQLVQEAMSLPWPNVPSFIFTSGNFDTDEVFKVWCGSKVGEGVPYFAGQHGNNYGTHFYAGNRFWPERSESDHFFSWGWSDDSPNVVPAFIFKTANMKSGRFDPEGGLLLVEYCVPHRITPWDSYFEFGVYQEEQFRFVGALPDSIRQKVTVRLHSEYKKHEWSDEQRWRDRSSNTKVETGETPIRELISGSRLVIHSYDSSGLLETLALDIPTICFWHGGLDHLLPGAWPYYELLRSAGILVDTPEKAAEEVSSKWDNIGDWWKSEKVQFARRAFCDQYAIMEKNPVRMMKRLLIAHSIQGER